MNFDTAKGEFEARFYRWSLRRWQDELTSNFASLERIGTEAADRCVRVLRSRPLDVVQATTVALTKRAHPDALPVLGESLTARERGLLQDFDTRRHLARQFRSGAGMSASRRRAVAGLLKQRLAAVGDPERLGSLEWRFTRLQANWTIETYVDLGGPMGDLAYWHRLLAGETCITSSLISLLSWLGVANTQWRVSDETEVMTAAEKIVSVTGVFVSSIPDLIAGLAWNS